MDWTAKPYIAPNTLHCVDAFELLAALPDASVDMCLTDMPYGTTACAWDTVIDLDAWWVEMRRVMKPRGAVVCTASQPFTSKLVMSNLDWFRYEWVWEKTKATNFLNAKIQPLRTHENILIFYDEQPFYSPQYIERVDKSRARYAYTDYAKRDVYGDVIEGYKYKAFSLDVKNPNSIIKFKHEHGKHPTQKPVALFEYLIKTYTNAGDLVIDPFVGSGTTAVAAHIAGRRFICGDQSPEYIEIARRRVFPEFGKPPKRAKEIKPLSDLPLFADVGE